jgi:hypothetical protein
MTTIIRWELANIILIGNADRTTYTLIDEKFNYKIKKEISIEDLKEADLSDIRSAFICDIEEYEEIVNCLKNNNITDIYLLNTAIREITTLDLKK